MRDSKRTVLLSIWHCALEALRTADEWIVIGYSMPPQDYVPRRLRVRRFVELVPGPVAC